MRRLVWGIAFLGLGALHCSNHDPDVERLGGEPLPDAGTDTSVELVAWCDVQRIVHANCLQCHGDPPDPGPFPLVTYQNTQADYSADRKVYEVMGVAVGSGFMPLIADGLPPATPLDDDEKATIVTWSEQGGMLVGPEECPEVPAAGGAAGAGAGGAPSAGAGGANN